MWCLYVIFPTLCSNLKKKSIFFTENLCLFFLDTAKCTYLYCSKFSLLEFGLTARCLPFYNDNVLFCLFMNYVFDQSYCVAVLSS